MSVDYSIIVKRKSDNKKIAEFFCNQIKSLLDSEYSHIIHCNNYRYEDHPKFTTDELSTLSDLIYQKIVFKPGEKEDQCFDEWRGKG